MVVLLVGVVGVLLVGVMGVLLLYCCAVIDRCVGGLCY